VSADFLSRVQSVIARCKSTRHLPVWLRALAGVTTLALLVSLFWLAPWQARHDVLAPVRQPMPSQASDRPAAELTPPTPQLRLGPPAASTGSGQVSDVGAERSQTSRVAPGQEGRAPTPSEEPTEVLDTQAMQGLVTRLEAAGNNQEEHLDTRAMDRLLAELTDKPMTPRSKGSKKRARVSPRSTADRGAPGTVSPPQADTGPLRAASDTPFPDMAR
jgi:hypothetical protein